MDKRLNLYAIAALWAILVSLAWCGGCNDGPARCPIDREQSAIQAAAQAWWADGLPVEGCNLAELHVQWTRTAEEFKDRCAVTPEYAAACYLHDTVDGVYRTPLIVVAPGVKLTEEGRPLVHETLHYLDECSGRAIDYGHADVLVWEPMGVEGEAHRFMREMR